MAWEEPLDKLRCDPIHRWNRKWNMMHGFSSDERVHIRIKCNNGFTGRKLWLSPNWCWPGRPKKGIHSRILDSDDYFRMRSKKKVESLCGTINGADRRRWRRRDIIKYNKPDESELHSPMVPECGFVSSFVVAIQLIRIYCDYLLFIYIFLFFQFSCKIKMADENMLCANTEPNKKRNNCNFVQYIKLQAVS